MKVTHRHILAVGSVALFLGIIVIANSLFQSKSDVTPCRGLKSLTAYYLDFYNENQGGKVEAWSSCTGKIVEVASSKEKGDFRYISAKGWKNNNIIAINETYYNKHPRYGGPDEELNYQVNITKLGIPDIKPEINTSAIEQNDFNKKIPSFFNDSIQYDQARSEATNKAYHLIASHLSIEESILWARGSIKLNPSNTRGIYIFTNDNYKDELLDQIWYIDLKSEKLKELNVPISSNNHSIYWISENTFLYTNNKNELIFQNVDSGKEEIVDKEILTNTFQNDGQSLYYYKNNSPTIIDVRKFNTAAGIITDVQTIMINKYGLEVRAFNEKTQQFLLLVHTPQLPKIYTVELRTNASKEIYDLQNAQNREEITSEYLKPQAYPGNLESSNTIKLWEKYILFNKAIIDSTTNEVLVLPRDYNQLTFKP